MHTHSTVIGAVPNSSMPQGSMTFQESGGMNTSVSLGFNVLQGNIHFSRMGGIGAIVPLRYNIHQGGFPS